MQSFIKKPKLQNSAWHVHWSNPGCGAMHMTHISLFSAAVVTTPRRPTFSWDTLPLYQHLANPNATAANPFSTTQLHWLAKFPLVIIEHAQGQGYMYAPNDSPNASKPGIYGPEPYNPVQHGGCYKYLEAAAEDAAKAIRDVNDATIVLFYQNGDAALPFYRQTQRITNTSYRAKDCVVTTTGDGTLPHYGAWKWDETNAIVQNYLTEQFLQTVTAPGSKLDGTFIDTAGASCLHEPAQHAGLLETARMMQASAPNKIVALHSMAYSDFTGIAASMEYTLSTPAGHGSKSGSGARGVGWMQANEANGVISLCHIGATLYDANYNYSLATFLIGLNNQSYFAFSDTYKKVPSLFAQRWTDCSPNFTSPLAPGGVPAASNLRYPWPAFPTWCSGQGFSPDYFRPLGAPRSASGGVATGRGNGEVTRSFASGTNVSIALTGETCVIEWADGFRTVCAGGARVREERR